MATMQRWLTAQEYEKGYWATRSSLIGGGTTAQLDWYNWRAEQLTARLERLGLGHLGHGDSTVLEVGSGPVGLLAYLAARERISVDPLNDFYGTDPVLSARRSPGVSYRKGIGEDIPCTTGACDLVITENCIDHVQDVEGVGRELNRVARPGGILFLTVNCRTKGGYYVHRTMSRLRIDAGHPHTFTPERALAFVERHGFQPLQHDAESAWASYVADLRGPGWRTRLKAITGVSEYLFSIVARKVAPA
jgi:SAM-dependent methyltransferase